MLTVAEGVVLGACVIDAHPAMRSNVILARTELMKLVFIDSKFLIGFYGVGFFELSYEFCQVDGETPIGL